MYQYIINNGLSSADGALNPTDCPLILLTSEEVDKTPKIPQLESVIIHTPNARDARVCKTESRQNCITGTIVTPRHTKDGTPIAFGYLLTPNGAVLRSD